MGTAGNGGNLADQLHRIHPPLHLTEHGVTVGLRGVPPVVEKAAADGGKMYSRGILEYGRTFVG